MAEVEVGWAAVVRAAERVMALAAAARAAAMQAAAGWAAAPMAARRAAGGAEMLAASMGGGGEGGCWWTWGWDGRRCGGEGSGAAGAIVRGSEREVVRQQTAATG